MNLILAATEKELEFLPTKHCFPVGIGMVQASIGTYEAIKQHSETSFVVFIGSCGVSEDLDLLTCYYSQTATLYQPGYMPTAMTSSWTSPVIQPQHFGHKLPSFRSANSISTKATHKTAENMEIAGVAAVCNHLNVGWCILSCSTNYIGENAHEEWTANNQEAARITADLLLAT